jgi:hypothetical protein
LKGFFASSKDPSSQQKNNNEKREREKEAKRTKGTLGACGKKKNINNQKRVV